MNPGYPSLTVAGSASDSVTARASADDRRKRRPLHPVNVVPSRCTGWARLRTGAQLTVIGSVHGAASRGARMLGVFRQAVMVLHRILDGTRVREPATDDAVGTR
ncbi:hypothetical protein GCM10022207_48190 [Streptomyces lannensis]|uniref:Uncharacterized protein n=1 Tax=Streptomyces lannensis TaxID=766498 RepID=A0ABP7KH20_9ACTN